MTQGASSRRGRPAVLLAPAPGSADGHPRRAGRVVCAVDGSAGAGRTLDEADALARALRSRLVVVRVGGDRTGSRAVARLLEVVSTERAELLLVRGPPRGLFGAALPGRGLRKLLRHAPCPVVAVPAGAEPAPRICRTSGSIVYGVGTGAGLGAGVAARLADRLGARLIAVHAYDQSSRIALDAHTAALGEDPAEDDIRRAWRLLSRTVDELGDAAEARLVLGRPGLMLNAVSAREHSRLIVVGARAAGRLRSTLSPSVAMQLASTATTPVVITPSSSSALR